MYEYSILYVYCMCTVLYCMYTVWIQYTVFCTLNTAFCTLFGESASHQDWPKSQEEWLFWLPVFSVSNFPSWCLIMQWFLPHAISTTAKLIGKYDLSKQIFENNMQKYFIASIVISIAKYEFWTGQNITSELSINGEMLPKDTWMYKRVNFNYNTEWNVSYGQCA